MSLIGSKGGGCPGKVHDEVDVRVGERHLVAHSSESV